MVSAIVGANQLVGEARRVLNRLCLLGGFCVITLFSSCGSSSLSEPIGIGPDRDELKQSPCSCFEIPQNYAPWVRA